MPALLHDGEKTSIFGEEHPVDGSRMAGIRSNAQFRSSGIPKSGSLKPASESSAKSKLTSKSGKVESKPANKTLSVTKKNHSNSKSQHSSVPNSPVKSLLRQNQTSPTKHTSAKANKSSDYVKANSAQSQEAFSTTGQCEKNNEKKLAAKNASPLSFVSKKREFSLKSNLSKNATPNAGIGLGGGSVPQKAFSYVVSGSPVHHTKNSSTKINFLPQPQSGLKPPSHSNIPLETFKKASRRSSEIDSNRDQEDNVKKLDKKTVKASEKLTLETNTLTKLVDLKTDMAASTASEASQNLSQTTASEPAVAHSHLTTPHGKALKKTKINKDQPDLVHKKNAGNFAEADENDYFNGRLNRSFRINRPKPVSIPTIPVATKFSDKSNTKQSFQMLPKSSEPSADSAKSKEMIFKQAASSPPPSVKPDHLKSPTPLLSVKDSSSCSRNQSSNNAASSNNLQIQPARSKPKLQKEKRNLFGLSKSIRSKNNDTAKTNSSTNASDKSKVALTSTTVKSKGSPIEFLSRLAKHTKLSPPVQSKNKTNFDKHKVPVSASRTTPNISFETLENIYANPVKVHKNSVSTSASQSISSAARSRGLIKTPSGSSLMTDSSASNLSSVPSLRTKKVSFQSDVTICDSNGISTRSNALRFVDAGRGSPQKYSSFAEASEKLSTCDYTIQNSFISQDCSIDARENNDAVDCQKTSHGYQPDFSSVRPNHSTKKYSYLRSYDCDPYFAADHELPCETVRLNSAKSAGEKASETDVNVDAFSLAPPLSNACKPFALSCESPVPFVVCQSEVNYKTLCLEETSTDKKVSESTVALENASLDENDNSFPEVFCQPILDLSKNSFTPAVSNVDQEIEVLETPAYYECCEPSVEENFNSDTVQKQAKETECNLTFTCGISKKDVLSQGSAKEHCGASIPNQDSRVDDEEAKLQEQTRSKQASVKHLLKLRSSATDLRKQLENLKQLHETNMNHIDLMIKEKMLELTGFLSQNSSNGRVPSRSRQATSFNAHRRAYKSKAEKSEEHLTEVEVAVDELRSAVVERRCVVSSHEVESLALQLSQVGHVIAELKNALPAMKIELQAVEEAELEAIYEKENFLKSEPLRIDEQLKRCRQLTSTLLTLKKLATVQEARSNTPLSLISSSTLDQAIKSQNDPVLHKKRMLDNVRGLQVDHHQRMELIKKSGKPNTTAENDRYGNSSKISDHVGVDSLQRFGDVKTTSEFEPTASETSSLDSLPSHPVNFTSDIYYPGTISSALHPGHFGNSPHLFLTPEGANVLGHHPLTTHPLESHSLEYSRKIAYPEHTGTLPSRTHSLRAGYDTSLPFRRAELAHRHNAPFVNPVQEANRPIERSTSVPPHLWNQKPSFDIEGRKTSLSYRTGNVDGDSNIDSSRKEYSDV